MVLPSQRLELINSYKGWRKTILELSGKMFELETYLFDLYRTQLIARDLKQYQLVQELQLLKMELQEQTFYNQLINPNEKVGLRYQAVFQLKNINTDSAIGKLVESYPFLNDSVLLSHQVLYTLGQLKDDKVPLLKDFLIGVVNDVKDNNLSRHEAAEALANYFLPELEDLYAKHLDSPCKELKWTCEIAIEKVRKNTLKVRYGKDYFETKEPGAPFDEEQLKEFLISNKLEETFKESGFLGLLLREDITLFHKYRIMYLMRNKKTEECIEVLCKLISKQYFKTQTSLLKHEICFILGQIGCGSFENLVRQCIENEQEEAIVRHEALAAAASQSKDPEYLNKFINNEDRLIRQSAQVAQFQIHYWND